VTGELTVVIVEPDIPMQRRLRGLRPAIHGAAGFVAPPSDPVLLRDLADALLAALGKDPLLRLSRSNPVAVASAWLATAPPPEIVVCDAHLLSRRVLDELLAWLAGFDTAITLVAVDKTPAYPRPFVAEFTAYVTGHHGAVAVDEEDLATRWPDQAPAHPGDGGTWPEIPLVAGVRFRRTARALLDPDAFALVDERFCSTAAAVRTEISAIAGKHPAREVTLLLRKRLDGAATTAEFVIDTRAAEVAALTSGFELTVDPVAMVAAAERFPRRGRKGPEGWWDRLSSYREPGVPATVALYDAELSVDDIAELSVGSVTRTDAGAVAVEHPSAGRRVLGDPQGRFVLAQRLYREYSGASEADPLFVTHRHPRITGRYARATLVRAETDLALRILPAGRSVRQPDARDWLRHHSIKVRMLDRADGQANQ
jgi:hypothetical protein